MNKVIIKHSTVPGKIPTAADLAFGEIALNIADGRMYAKRSDGVVEPLAQSVDLKSFGTISADVGSMSATGPSQTFSVKGGSGIRVTALSGTRELVVALNNADAATLGGRASSYFSPATHLHDDRYLKLQAQGGDYYTKAQVDGNITAAIDALIGGAGSAYDTLKELENALNGSDSAIASINATLATKLNASNYTAADVLSKLKTVDGASSGLDADLLDGQQASYYLSASNLNAGTVPVARLSGIYGIGISGNAATASKLAAPYSLSLAGHASGTVSMDGSANATLTVTVANDSHTHDARYYEKSLSDARYYTKSQSDARYTQPSQVQGAFLDRFGDYFASTGDNNTSNPGDTGLWATTRPGTPNFPGFAWIKTQRTYSNTAAYQFGINYDNVASPGVPKVAYRLRGSSAAAWGQWAEVLFSGHSGDGSGLTALNASNLASGTVNAARLPAATTSVQGAVQLNNTVTSTSTTQAATANAAKVAHDAANAASSNANSRVSKSGDTMTNKLVINNANYQSHLQLVRGDLSVDISPSTVTGGELRFATTNIAKTVFDTSLEATSFMGGWAGLDYAAISTRLTLKNPSIPLSFEDTAQIGFIEHGDTYGLRIRTRVGTTGTGIAETFTVSNSGGVSWTGVASGNGSGLTSLNASNLASGTVPIARISSTSARNSSSETTLLHAKAMNDHIVSGDHDSRYVNKSGDSMSGDLSISKSNPWLTLNSATSGANGVEQAAGLSIGESGYKGNAAMHLTYTGDGRGYIGMGTVDPLTSIPANAAMRMFYTSPNVEFLGTVSGNGSGLSALNASNLASGTIPDARISGSYTGMANLTGSGNVDFARFLGNATDTVTSPSFSWTGDTDTGLYRPAADTIGVSVAGVERARFSSAGISGVGTGLTSLNASNLTTGTVPIARISSTSARNSTSESTLLHAKAMNDHVASGDHDGRYVNKAGDTTTGTHLYSGDIGWIVSTSNTARQRVDARTDETSFARLHCYGISNTGATSNFRHAWYDGTNYIPVTASAGKVTFGGGLEASSLQITPGTGIALGNATPSTSYNINMNDTFSANGTRAAIYSIANISDGTLTGNRTHYGIYNSLRNDYLSTESYTLTQRAAYNEVVNGPANDEAATINTAEGSRNYVLNRANGTISSAIGCYNYVLTSRAGSTITNAYGSYNYVQHSLGTITNAYAGYFRVAGTITGHSFGLYVTGEDKNYFSGNVGIKTSSPTAELEVVGTVKATSFVGSVPSASLPSSVVNTDSKSNSGYLWIHRNSTSSALYITNQSTGRIAEFRSGSGDGAVQCYINNNGSIFSTDNITAYSDARLKTNIQPIKKALFKLEMLGGYTFDRTDKPGLRQTGVIAQEVLQVLPEAVVEQEDGKLAVAYGNMVGLLIEAIKELNAKVETLQEQLNAAA